MRRASALLLVAVGCGGGDGVAPPPPPPPSLGVVTIEVTGATSVAAGGNVQLTAIAKDAAGVPMPGISFTWQSSATNVATVSNAGLLHGVGTGTATITARADGKTGTLALIVRDTASLPATLTGRIERVDLTIAANQTYQVTGNTTIVADSTLLMEGTLEIATGATLTLYGGKLLRITGILDGDSAAGFTFGSERIEILGEPPAPAISAPATIRIRGHHAPNGPIRLNARVIIIGPNAKLRAGPGVDGTTAHPNGGLGANVEIGTQAARDDVAAKTGKPPKTLEILEFDVSEVSGGKGGSGLTLRRANGTVVANTWTGIAGNGGRGGDVRIIAQKVESKFSTVGAGFGGYGGDIVLTGEQGLRTGTGPDGAGESFDGTSGSGGRGGDVVVTANQVTGLDLYRKLGGQNGAVTLEGGNGFDGGKGGNLRIVMGDLGDYGSVTPAALDRAENLPPFATRFVYLTSSANGGGSRQEGKAGGAGGKITLTGIGGTRAPVYLLNLTDVANGGPGFDGCVEPKRDGTDGGPGGQRELEVRPNLTIEETGGNFNGGAGGPGYPINGRGGSRGLQLEGPGGERPLGTAGPDGTLCPPQTGIIRIAVVNFAAGLAIVTGVDPLLSTPPMILPLSGPITLEALESDPHTLVIGGVGTSTLAKATVDDNGEVHVDQTRTTPSPVTDLDTSGRCTHVVQPGRLLSYDEQLNLMGETGVPELRSIQAGGSMLHAHAGSRILVFRVDGNCRLIDLRQTPPFESMTLMAISPDQTAMARVFQEDGGQTFINISGLDANGLPPDGPFFPGVSVPGRVVGVGWHPSGDLVYAVGDLGQVTVIDLRRDVFEDPIVGTFVAPGIDDFQVVSVQGSGEARSSSSLPRASATTGESLLFYTNASSPSLGRVCVLRLGPDGLPTALPLCEQNSTRPRPDSDLVVLGPASGTVQLARGIRAPR